MDGNVAYSSTYIFDPKDRSWARSGLMHTARSGPAAVLLADGRVLIWGGTTDSERKAAIALPLLAQPGQTYDVSSPDLPTVR